MNIRSKNLSLGIFSLCTLVLLCSSTFGDKFNSKADPGASCSNVHSSSLIGGGTGDLLGFYTPLFASGTLPIQIVDFPKLNGSTSGIALTNVSTFNYAPTSVLLPTNTSSFNPATEDLVCLVSREQELFMYNDNNCTSSTMNLAPSWTTAPVYLGGQLYGIDIENNGYGTGSTVDLEIVNNIQTGIINGVAPFSFNPIAPYTFNHEQMSSATNGTDELYFVSGIDLIKVSNLGSINVMVNQISLDPSNQYIYYGLEYCRPNVLLAIQKNNFNNPTASLELVQIQLNGLATPTITVKYDLQSKVTPSPPGWILNHEFYSSALDTCDKTYYLTTLHDTNGSSKLIEINIGNGSHVQQIFMDYLFGIEFKDLSCGPCTCGTFSDLSYRPFQGAPNVSVSCGETLTAQCDGTIPWTLGGNFMCNGSDCPDSTEITWTLYQPGGAMTSGPASADPGFNISIPASEFSTTGLYQLILSAVCGLDTCYCEFLIEVQCDTNSCCTDFDTFLTAAHGVDVLGELGDCMLHYNVSGLDSCMQISFVWGDFPQIVEGPYPNDTAVWHTYSGPGVYNVCYLIEQVSPPDSICWAYEHCEDVEIICDSCYCGDFSDMIIHVGHGHPNHPVSCGGDTVSLGCPLPGVGYILAGLFECHGNTCPAEDTLSWTLTGPGVPHSGTSVAYPYFTIHLLPTYFAQPGLYTLVLNGHCGNEECVCIINFYVDCPNLCPCDIQALSDAVDQGFAQTLYSNSCKACFSPIALSDCETVEWHIGSINNPSIASSVGNQTICHNFNNSGTYTVIMVVTRLRPDGTTCEVFVKSQTVTVNCVPLPICDMSIFPNPGFDEGAVEGGLNSGGATTGWIGIWGDPHISHERAGSLNKWTIELQSNNADTVDVLSTLEPVCLEKGTGVIKMRMEFGIKEQGIRSSINISLLRGDDYTLGIDWTTTDCHVLIDMDISEIDTGEWVDIEIPYDITSWLAEDDCTTSNGVLVRPVIRQRCCSRPKDLDKVYLDYFCMGETSTSTDDLAQNENIRIFPNPTEGNFTLQFDNKVPAKCKVQVIDIEGRILQTKTLNSGHPDQGINISNLSTGIYFIKIIENGNPVWMDKIIKL